MKYSLKSFDVVIPQNKNLNILALVTFYLEYLYAPVALASVEP